MVNPQIARAALGKQHADEIQYAHFVNAKTYFTYLEITHPADRILVVEGAALVTGRMTAKVLVEGAIVHGCRQSLPGGLGARARRLEIRRLSADADHQGLSTIADRGEHSEIAGLAGRCLC